jgi:peptide/nickel transport system substrate-binding protein
VTLKITLTAPNSAFPELIATTGPMTMIGSPTAIAKEGASFANAPVGAGPYVLKEWIRHDHMTLERNPQYYGKTYLDEIIIKDVPDEQQRYNTLVSRGADMSFTTDPTVLKRATQGGFKANVFAPNGGDNVVFNLSKPPFDDIRARQALLYAWDLNKFNQTLFAGASEPISTIFEKGTLGYDPTIKFPKHDAKKAQALFDQLAAAGRPVNFQMLAYQGADTWASELQSQLASFKNVTMTINVVPIAAVFTGYMLPGNFQASTFVWAFNDPLPTLYNFVVSGASRNTFRYSNPTLDAAFTQAVSSLDSATKAKAYKTVQRELVKDLPAVFLVRAQYAVLHSNQVQGYSSFDSNSPLWTSIWKTST